MDEYDDNGEPLIDFAVIGNIIDYEKLLIGYVERIQIDKVKYFNKIKYLIENTRVNINYKESGYGETALMISCGNSYDDDNLPLVQLLLENGANPNIKNSVGDTALTYAAMNNYDIVELLLKNGANPLIKNNDGQTVSNIIYDDAGGVLSVKDNNLLQLLKKYMRIYRNEQSDEPSDPDIDLLRDEAARYIQTIMRARIETDKKRKLTKRRYGKWSSPKTKREKDRRYMDLIRQIDYDDPMKGYERYSIYPERLLPPKKGGKRN